MAKNHRVQPERSRSRRSSKALDKANARTKTRSSAAVVNAKTKRKVTRSANDGDTSSEETQVVAAPSSSAESINEEAAVESSEADEVADRRSADEDEDEDEKEPQTGKRKGKKEDVRRSRKEEDDEEDAQERGENESCPYRFPMNRVGRIIKSENPDLKISQEAVFLINRATEKFLQLFCKEAYACASLDKKNYTAYHHLSSVVSRKERFKFLSDFIPEKVKAEDALAHITEAEKENNG